MKRLAALLALLVLTCVPVSACLNDSETQNAEQEFRSSYLGPPGGAHGQPLVNYFGKRLLFLIPGLILVVVAWRWRRREAGGPGGDAGGD